ncbi:hypothetical protein BGZ83_003017 [Gryganskiella cystojenkinii]|nr:hypothetical protein BGZ83_003017 [Gryganskiella cystojenkinii]
MVPTDDDIVQNTPSSPQDNVLTRLCALANKIEQEDSPSTRRMRRTGSKESTVGVPHGAQIDDPFDFQEAKPLPGIDLRALDIQQPTIFESFWTGVRPTNDQLTAATGTSLSSLSANESSLVPSSSSPSSLFPSRTAHDEADYDKWNSRTVFGALSHPASASIVDIKSSLNIPSNNTSKAWKDWNIKRKLQIVDGVVQSAQNRTTTSALKSTTRTRRKDDVELLFELPTLTKRPHDILDDCLDREGQRLDKDMAFTGNNKFARRSLFSSPKKGFLDNGESGGVSVQEQPQSNVVAEDLWLAAGKHTQESPAGKTTRLAKIGSQRSRYDGRPLHSQLSWETCTRTGPALPLPSSTQQPNLSPFVTEADLPLVASLMRRFVQ